MSNYQNVNNPEEKEAKKNLLKGSYTFGKRLQEMLCLVAFIILVGISLVKMILKVNMVNLAYFFVANTIAMIVSDFFFRIVSLGM